MQNQVPSVTPPPVDVVPSNAFPQLLVELDDGVLQNEASQKLIELLQHIALTQKPGKIILEITAAPAAKGALKFVGSVRTKVAPVEAEPTLLFVDQNNGYRLTKSNPAQAELKFRTLAKQDEVRKVESPAQIAANS